MTSHIKARRAALLVGAALLGAYLSVAAFSQMPLNPVKLRYYDRVNSVMQPYLAQNWMLFAPDPLSDERGILARARCSDGHVTDFYNVTRPYVEREQNDRFFASRTNRLVSGTISQLNNSDPILDRMRKSEEERKQPVIPLAPYEKTTREQAEKFLSRFSLRQLADVCSGNPVAAVQVRAYVHTLPPWSKRKDPSAVGEATVQDLSWQEAGALK
ncbi:DUF5819 family protein [Streptomyces sp. NPDC055254]